MANTFDRHDPEAGLEAHHQIGGTAPEIHDRQHAHGVWTNRVEDRVGKAADESSADRSERCLAGVWMFHDSVAAALDFREKRSANGGAFSSSSGLSRHEGHRRRTGPS